MKLIGTVTTVYATVDPLEGVGGDRAVRRAIRIDTGVAHDPVDDRLRATDLSVRVAGAVLCRDGESLSVRSRSRDDRPTAWSGKQDAGGAPVDVVCS